MKNSELAKQAYAFEQVVRDAFEKLHAIEIGSGYDYDKYELTSMLDDGDQVFNIEITGYDYRCGGDYESFTIPAAALDDIDAYVERRKVEIEEAKRQKEAQKLAEDAKKKAATEQQERATYLKLKEKYEG